MYSLNDREFYLEGEKEKITLQHSFKLPPLQYLRAYFNNAHFFLKDDALRVILPLKGGGNSQSSRDSKRDAGREHEEKRIGKVARDLGYSFNYLSVFFQGLGSQSAKKLLAYRNGVISGFFEEFNTNFEDFNSMVGVTKKEELNERLLDCMVGESSLIIVVNVNLALDFLIESLLASSEDPFLQGANGKRKELLTLYYNSCKACYEENVATLALEEEIETNLKNSYKDGITNSKDVVSRLKEEIPNLNLNQCLSAAKVIVAQFVNCKISQIHTETLSPLKVKFPF